MKIRTGNEADVDIVNAFYATEAHFVRVSVGERFVLAEDGRQLIGVVRLCNEHGHWVLRTMRVKESYRRQGIGKQMLEVFEFLLRFIAIATAYRMRISQRSMGASGLS